MLEGARRLGALLVVVPVVALASCTDDDAGSPTAPGTVAGPPPSVALSSPTSAPTSPTTTTATTTGPTTPVSLPVDRGELGPLDAGLAADGTLDLDAALGLFAAGYAPLPGIEPAATTPVDGGPVLRAVLGAVDQLDEAQRTAVGRVVAPAGEPLDQILSGPGAPPRLRAAARITRAALEAFGGARGRPLSDDVATTLLLLPYANGDGTHNFTSPRSIATAVPVGDGARPYAECRIRINRGRPLGRQAGRADAAFVSSVAHEVFHCLQYEVLPFTAGAPQWVVEGAAAYAGEDFAGGSRTSAAWWRRWVRQPQRPLDRRTYDAIGFFSLLPSTTNPYAFADALLTDPSVDSVRRRLEASDVFDRWGLAYATRPRWGRNYAITGPGAPAVLEAPRQRVALRVDQPATVAGGPAVVGLAAAPLHVRVPGDVLVVTADPGDRGGLRFRDGQEAALAEATQAYCVRPGGCRCPGVPRDATPATPVESNVLFVGVGPSSGGGPMLAARSLGQWCQEVLVPAPPAGSMDQCLVGAWTSRAYVAPGVSGATQTVTGGEGVVLEFRPDRTVTVEMDASSPAVVTLTGPDGATVTTTIEYAGAGTGTWSAVGGVVNVAGVDASSFVVRVRIESSTQGVLAERELPATDVRLSGFAGLLGTGRYECTAVSLTVTHVVPGVGGEAGFEFVPA